MQIIFFFCLQIIFTVCCLATALAKPQDYNEQLQNQQPQYNTISKDDDRSTTTWIPILEYNKEQGEDGSYKTS